MKRILSSLLIVFFMTSILISPSIVLANTSQSEIKINKDNSQEMLNKALAGDQEVIKAAKKLQAFQKSSVQKALEKINFQDGKSTHTIDFNDNSSIVIDNGPGQYTNSTNVTNTTNATISANVTRSSTSVIWPYYYKVYVAGIEWSRYTVSMKYWLCLDGKNVSLDMDETKDGGSGLYGITIWPSGVTAKHTDDYYCEAEGKAFVTGLVGSFTVYLDCYGLYDMTKNWSKPILM